MSKLSNRVRNVKNAVFWDVAVTRTYVSVERIASIIGVEKISELHLLVAANVVPSWLILSTLTAIRFSETSFLQEPYCVTSQRKAFLIVTCVKTSHISELVLNEAMSS
jgi:hypothetical protein